MPWFRVDDNFPFHPKVLRAGNAAVGLWTRAGTWSMQVLSDGDIPADMARSLGTRGEIGRLLDSGLWVPDGPSGYRFHDWAERQPSRDKIIAEREANAERIRRWREKKASQKSPDSDM